MKKVLKNNTKLNIEISIEEYIIIKEIISLYNQNKYEVFELCSKKEKKIIELSNTVMKSFILKFSSEYSIIPPENFKISNVEDIAELQQNNLESFLKNLGGI